MAKKKEGRKQIGGDEFRRTLKGDDTYLKYRRILKNINEKMDLETFYTEITTLHAGRVMRNLYGTTPGASKISDAVLQDVRCRSRLVELVLKSTRYHDILDLTLDETRKYLSTKYADEAPALRTKQERQSYFDVYLTKGISTLANLKSLAESANLVIKDIDQCSHATRHLIECLELVLDRNNDKQRN